MSRHAEGGEPDQEGETAPSRNSSAPVLEHRGRKAEARTDCQVGRTVHKRFGEALTAPKLQMRDVRVRHRWRDVYVYVRVGEDRHMSSTTPYMGASAGGAPLFRGPMSELGTWQGWRMSISAGPVPFSITARVRIMPPRRRNGAMVTGTLANAVFPAVQALIADRDLVAGTGHAPLDRARIARWCGIGDLKRAGWLFEYLEMIGFLTIERHYNAPGQGRESDTYTELHQVLEAVAGEQPQVFGLFSNASKGTR